MRERDEVVRHTDPEVLAAPAPAAPAGADTIAQLLELLRRARAGGDDDVRLLDDGRVGDVEVHRIRLASPAVPVVAPRHRPPAGAPWLVVAVDTRTYLPVRLERSQGEGTLAATTDFDRVERLPSDAARPGGVLDMVPHPGASVVVEDDA